VNVLFKTVLLRANVSIRTHPCGILNDLPKVVEANRDLFVLLDGEIPIPANAQIQGGN
jgi:hypothetical protein